MCVRFLLVIAFIYVISCASNCGYTQIIGGPRKDPGAGHGQTTARGG